MKKDTPSSPASPAYTTGGNCGVNIERFPHPGCCYEALKGKGGPGFINLCPHCSILTLLPDGANLEIATFFECTACGYTRRITDGRKREKNRN